VRFLSIVSLAHSALRSRTVIIQFSVSAALSDIRPIPRGFETRIVPLPVLGNPGDQRQYRRIPEINKPPGTRPGGIGFSEAERLVIANDGDSSGGSEGRTCRL
jgi:hypothetical protein